MKRKPIKLAAAIIAAATSLSAVPLSGVVLSTAYAANPIGSITVDGKKTQYNDLKSLVNEAKKLKGKNFAIDMTDNWGNERLVIPKESKVVLNMNGFMYNRGLTDNQNDGEVICIADGATLTINGGPESISHNVNVYTGSTSYSDVKRTSKTFSGGVIAGGFSSNGAGGIDITGSGVTLNLKGVTIAGCRAAQTWGTDGYGGGIWVHGGVSNAGTVNLTDSTVTGCYATNDGGGIYQNNHNNFSLSLIDSHVDDNWCGGKGGGIHVRGEDVIVSGSGDSTVNSNHSGDHGGGIYIWNDDTKVSGLTVDNNRAAGHGGGVYTLEENIELTNLSVNGNHSDKNGGGIYIYNDENRIFGLKATGNSAGGNGGGIFVEDDVDEGFNVSGICLIKDNTASGATNNFTLLDESTKVNFDLSGPSEVYMGYQKLPGNWALVTQGEGSDKKGKDSNVVKSPNCIRYLHPDNSGWEFRFNPDQHYRKIFYVRPAGSGLENTGSPYSLMPSANVDKIPSGTIDSGNTITGQSGKTYPVGYGYFRSSEGGGKVFYSDGFFDSDPFVYNEHLATASMAMAMAGCYTNEGGKGKNADYSYKHAAAREFMSLIGCDDQNIYVNDFNIIRPQTDSIGVTMASKDIQIGDETYTLIPMTMRSANYESEWASNVFIGDGADNNGEARGFAEAADQVMDALDTYIKKYDLEEKVNSGKAIFWVTGFSRGGATANLTSKRIRETYNNAKLFGYTFATPRGGSNNATKLPDEEYFCIHNTINSADLVPYVAMAYMGFVHYGVDHYMPGGPAGQVTKTVTPLTAGASGTKNNLSETVTYSDNEPYLTKTSAYESMRDNGMEHQLSLIDPEYEWDDYYHKARISLNPMRYIAGSQNPYEIEGTEEKAEDLMVKLFKALQSNVVPIRDDYTLRENTYGNISMSTYQKALRDMMAIIYGDNADMLNKLMDIGGTFSFSDLSDFDLDYLNAIGFWSQVPDSKKASLLTILMKHAKATGLYDGISDDDKENFEYNLPALLDMALKIMDYDITEASLTSDSNLQLTGSLAYNLTRIFQNHQLPVYLGWLRAQDSFYDDETQAYKLNMAASVPALTAKPKYNTDVVIEANNTGNPAEFKLNETIMLDVPEVGGEAIYYTLENLTLGTSYKDKLYRGGLNLDEIDKDHPYMDYRITAHARYLEAVGDTYTFDIRIIGDTHEVTIDYSDYPDQTNVTNYFKEGEDNIVMARLLDGLEFTGWKVYDDQGRDVTYLLGDTVGNAVGKFTMPMPESDGFSKIYSLRFVPQYNKRVDNAELLIPQPVYGEELAKTATVILRCGSEEITRLEAPVSWSFEQKRDKKTINVITNHAAYNSTAYTASVRIDGNEDFAFGKHITAAVPEAVNVGCSKNTHADYAYVTAVFAPTESGRDWDREAVELNIQAWDINMDTAVKNNTGAVITKTIYVDPDSKDITVYPPEDPQNEVFTSWDALDSGITISDEAKNSPALVINSLPESKSVTLRANYLPVIKNITAQVMAPVATFTPDTESNKVKVTVFNNYEIDNNNISYEWSPSPDYGSENKEFNYETVYTLTMKIVPDSDGRVHLTRDGNDYYVTGQFVYSDEIVTEVIPVNSTGETIKDMDLEVIFDKDQNVMSVSFPATGQRKTDLKYITWPEDISDVPFEQIEAGLEAVLPTELEIGVKDQRVDHLPVSWTIRHTGGPTDGTGQSEWTADGVVELPDRIRNKYNYELTGSVKITVDGSNHAEAPDATVPSGRYFDDLLVGFEPLETGGEIRYTLDGSDPANGTAYNGEDFNVSSAQADSEGFVTLRSVTLTPGHQNSAEAVYLYHFTNQVPVPVTRSLDEKREGRKDTEDDTEIREVYEGVIPEFTYNTKPQIIAQGKPQYTLTGGEGVTIDEDGNALATDAGVYTLTAKIKDGYVWVIKDPVTLEETTTTEDQVFKVAIEKASIAGAEVDLEDGPFLLSGKPVRPEVDAVVINGEVLDPAIDYDVEHKDNEQVGTGKAIVLGKGNFKDSVEVGFTIEPQGEDGEDNTQPSTEPTTDNSDNNTEPTDNTGPAGGSESEKGTDPSNDQTTDSGNNTHGDNTGTKSGGSEGGSQKSAVTDKKSGAGIVKAAGGSNAASTGDSNPAVIWIVVGCAAAAAGVTAAITAVRKRKNN